MGNQWCLQGGALDAIALGFFDKQKKVILYVLHVIPTDRRWLLKSKN